MTVGFIILAHEAPHHVARLAGHLAAQGAPVVVHLDRRADCRAELERGLPNQVRLISTQASEWGMYGLVGATLDAARTLLADHPGLGHVYLLSGACLPLRPVVDLQAFLADAPETDFIEAEDPDRWITGGLGIERFTLYHPVSWKRRRRWFDMSVAVQRRVGVRRSLPPGIAPRLGRQWWCLRAATLVRILEDPRLPTWERFFRSVWIPDESFFQSLVVSLLPNATRDARGLTLTRFDPSGNPLVLHDDHIGALAMADHFFARKIDPDANGLRDWAYRRPSGRGDAFDDTVPDALALSDHVPEHVGLQMAGRFPRGTGLMRPDTARPYLVLVGRDAGLLAELRHRFASSRPDWALHGRLFGKGAAVFADAGPTYTGNLSSDAVLRDYRPEQFLQRLIWIEKDRMTVFLMLEGDNDRVGDMILADPNARIALIGDPMLNGLDGNGPAVRANLLRLAPELASGAGAAHLIGEILAFADETTA